MLNVSADGADVSDARADGLQSWNGARRGTLGRSAAVLAAMALVVTLLATDVARPERAGASSCASSSTIAMAERAAEDRFLANLNELRNSRGLSPLSLNSAVSYESARWSATMAGRNTVMHDPSLLGGLVRVVSNLQSGAENVGRLSGPMGCTSTTVLNAVDRAVDTLHNNFMGSSSHYPHMVGAYNQVGIGVHIANDQLWVTTRFANGSLPAATSEATRRYVGALYQLFIGRNATPAEVSRWAQAVQSGNRGAVTQDLAVSNEWAGVRIADLYRSILGRNADAAGRQYWLSQVGAGARLEHVAAGFYASSEYFAYQGGTNRGFVSGLYRDILGRSADGHGLNHWTTILDRGLASRYEVAAGFYDSIESRNDRVTTLYREILNRRPDAGGLHFWATRLLTMGDVALAASLASSEEFYNRAT